MQKLNVDSWIKIKSRDMPHESLEAFIERIMPDMALIDEAMANENNTDRTELIITEIFCRLLDELRHLQWTLIEEGIEMRAENDFCVDNSTSVFKGSSPKDVGYAYPTKEIVQRFSDSDR
jgi:hypothetical protein